MRGLLIRLLWRLMNPILSSAMFTSWEDYIYVDVYGDTYRLKPTRDPGQPFIITLERRR